MPAANTRGGRTDPSLGYRDPPPGSRYGRNGFPPRAVRGVHGDPASIRSLIPSSRTQPYGWKNSSELVARLRLGTARLGSERLASLQRAEPSLIF